MRCRSGSIWACSSLADVAVAYVRESCLLYLGWRDACTGCRDGCNGCLSVPAKWGSVKVDSCALGAGLDNTCSTFTLQGTAIDMFGLSLEGDVDENDTVYVGLKCE